MGNCRQVSAFVEALVEARVGADDQMIGVLRIEDQSVVVTVLLAAGAEDPEGGAAVVGDMQEDVHLVNAIHIGGGSDDLLVVVGARAIRDVLVALLPALAPVRGAIETALVLGRLDGGVDHVGIGG